MLSFNELEKGITIIIDKQPYEILEASRLFKGRGHSVLQVKIKNLITGATIPKTFHPSDSFEEAEIKKFKAKFLYFHRSQFFFCEEKNPSKRFSLEEKQIAQQSKFLKANQIVQGIIFDNKVINIFLPIKINLKVIEAPPGVQGNRSQPGTKTVVLETKAKIACPLFIKQGDTIEINTETSEYVRRI
ncbi:MAG: elongation factor P [Minisyncoccales bacterium]